MTGFFTWDDATGYADDRRIYLNCPNCNQHIGRGRVETHTCIEHMVVDHHVSLLRYEFKLDTAARSNMPVGDSNRATETLTVWEPFEEWLRTPFGCFEQQWAEQHRPGGYA